MKGQITELLEALAKASPSQREAALRALRGQEITAVPSVEQYLTLRETAKRFGISAVTLWRWQVPGHELGGRRRFRLSEVEAYLQSDEFKMRADEIRGRRKKAAVEKTS